MRHWTKILGILLVCTVGFLSSGSYASESGHHGKAATTVENTAPGVISLHSNPPLEIFEPASTATSPDIAVIFPAIAAALAVLLALMGWFRKAQC